MRIIELAGVGPVPFAGMLLSDMGADILLVERMTQTRQRLPDHRYRLLNRNRRSLRVDLKDPRAVELILGLTQRADGFMEGYRPGVVERLGLGPDPCLARNPRLVFGRMTGWGQQGPMSTRAGFDLNYLSLTGALGALGERDRCPPPPLLMVGDFGGGATILALGMVAALFEARRSGLGQVVDAAIVDGVHNLMAYVHGGRAGGTWVNRREANVVDGGDFRYGTYLCADGRYVAVAVPVEPYFSRVLEVLDLDLEELAIGDPDDRTMWPAYRTVFARAFLAHTRDEWATVFDSDQHCVTPVLDIDEVAAHPHNVSRGAFVQVDGVEHPAPAPRFSRTPSAVASAPPRPGEGGLVALRQWGVPTDEIAALYDAGVIT